MVNVLSSRSIPGPDVTCGLKFLLVLVLAPRIFLRGLFWQFTRCQVSVVVVGR